ncbi:MFS transporter [Conexibacter sp. CPCC 206217]|uniref:MFS transporter n=1 Tax=Conexibacter sp. CPCC 206217 TaxID=3064574 RepID=UPI0027287190|nr:MFS transporter [Conexibacter sp. CPCC 206217]MDO8210336.1 MFS transporter [Conexibacter sp. CPCC 206217]
MAGPRADDGAPSVAASGAPEPDEPDSRPRPPGARDARWLALLVLCVPVVLLNVESTVVNVAIPTLVRDLRASASQLLWIVDGYGLAFACLVLTAGAFADRLGRRRVLIAGLAWFGASSALAAFAPTPELLIAARCAMGAGAALLYPTSLAIIVQLFDEPGERARAISVWAAVGTVGIVLGPLVGGALVDSFGWGAPFLINVPICAALLVATPLLVRVPRRRQCTPIDLPGLLVSVLGLVLLLYGVISGPEHGWGSAEVLVPIALGFATCAGFLWWESRCAHPMVDLRLFAAREYAAASTTIAVVYFALVGWSLLLTQYLQYVLGVDAFVAGLCLVPMALGQLGGAFAAPRLVRRLGRNVVVTAGVALLGLATLAFAFEPLVATLPLIVLNRVLEGIGIGLVVVPTTDSVMRSVSPERSSVGSAVNDTTRMTGAILGVGVLGSVFAAGYAASVGPLPFVPQALREHAASSVGSSFAVADGLAPDAAAQLLDSARDAFMASLRLTTLASVALIALAGVIAWRRLPRREVALTAPEGENSVPFYEINDPFVETAVRGERGDGGARTARGGSGSVAAGRARHGSDDVSAIHAAATADAPAPTGRYSQAVVAGELCFLAGQAPFTPAGELVPGDLEAQIRQCFNNLEAVATAAGTSLQRAVRIGVFLSPRVDIAEYNRVYAELIAQDPPPARTTVFSDFPGFDVEIDAVCLRA